MHFRVAECELKICDLAIRLRQAIGLKALFHSFDDLFVEVDDWSVSLFVCLFCVSLSECGPHFLTDGRLHRVVSCSDELGVDQLVVDDVSVYHKFGVCSQDETKKDT